MPVAPAGALSEFTPEPQKAGIDRWPLHRDGRPRWSIEHDLVEGATTVVSGARFVFDTPAAGGRIALDHTGRARVRRDRPDGANVVADTVIDATMPDGTGVRVTASTLVATNGIDLRGRVTVNGRTVFEKAWHR